MKLDLSVLKNVLVREDCGNEMVDIEIREWVKNNISDGEVDVKEWLSEFNKYWSEWSDDYGDSEMIENILVLDYKLSENKVDEVMMVYWGCDSIEEYIRDYK